MAIRTLSLVASLCLLQGCAHLYKVQLGDIDNSQGKMTRFEVKTSETGVDISEAAHLAGALSSSKSFKRTTNTVSSVWKLITYGPKTGEVTFSDNYADDLRSSVYSACPSRRITGLMSIREANKYPVISGEIVRLVGFCVASAAPSKERKKQ